MIRVRVKKLLHGFDGDFWLDVELEVRGTEFLVILGQSGSGKTTLLRCIAGLEKPEEGYIEVDGQVWFDSKRGINLPPQRRDVGFVFQDYALFPNMTVLENVMYGMKEKNRDYALELLRMAGLEGLRDKKPDRLSGGQKQRVALLRALAKEPRVLLLDEPLSALDPELRQELQKELKDFQRKSSIPALMVSHDREEALRLADRVIKVQRGRVIEEGEPQRILPDRYATLISKVQEEDGTILTLRIGDKLASVKVPLASP
ncbi:MAG: ABC transporter ATP-binding protein [Aquificaceae bacterium]|uniref:ABC transporter ATP-binding protein n=1 Tax=Hydrogenobacter sp. Uz 6-8 TaxID=3384828 RepID=UPI00309608CA